MFSRSTNKTFCSILSTVLDGGLTVTFTGSLKKFLESLTISLGSVAENNIVCLLDGIAEQIFLISGRNPISNIRSASSKTRTPTLSKRSCLWFKRSRSLPGVATKTSTPRDKARICKAGLTPPYITACLILRWRP